MQNDLAQLQTYINELKPNTIVRGPLFPEPVQAITTLSLGTSLKLIDIGLKSNQTYQSVLSIKQLVTLELTLETEPFDGDTSHIRLDIKVLWLNLVHEYAPIIYSLYCPDRRIPYCTFNQEVSCG